MRCVREILTRAPDVREIIVVDDHSNETGPPPSMDPRVLVLVNPENVGYGRSLHRAVSAATAEIVVVFDSDAYPLMDFVPPLSQLFASDPALGAVGFRTVDRHGRTTGSGEPEPTVAALLLGQRLHAFASRWHPPPADSWCLYTPAIAIRRATYDELGGLDTDTFDFLDLDLDFSMRLNRSRWHLRQSEVLVAFHEGAGSPQLASQRLHRFYQNRWRLLRKHGKIVRPALIRSAVSFRLAFELVVLLILGRLVFDKPTQVDKVRGRRLALRHVLEHWS